MKRLMSIAIFAVVSLSMMATARKVQMYDKPLGAKDVIMKNEVPTTVTYEGDTMRIVSDSLLTNVLITLRDLDGNIFLSRNESSIGNTPHSY